MDIRRSGFSVLFQATFGAACLLTATAPTTAQPSTNSPAEKWRPKEGLYAEPGADFKANCMEFGDLIVTLNEMHISGPEWGCDVTKLAESGPDAIKLNITCNDYNRAMHIKDPNPYDRKFKEIAVFGKIDATSMWVQTTVDRKFLRIPPGGRPIARRTPSACISRQPRCRVHEPPKKPRTRSRNQSPLNKQLAVL